MSVAETKRHWLQALLTPQTIIYILGGMIALVIFWTRTQESWAKVKALDTGMEVKADRADLKAVEDRVSRQYEVLNKQAERITLLEKQQEYQRGFQDGIKSK